VPGHGRLGTRKLEAGQLAHAATPAVTTDDILRQRSTFTLRGRERQCDVSRALLEADQLRLSPDSDATAQSQLCQVLLQLHLLDAAKAPLRLTLPRLVDQEQARKVAADLLDPLSNGTGCARGFGELLEAGHHRCLRRVQRWAEPAPDQGLRRERVHRPGLDGGVGLLQPLHHQHPAAIKPELRGQKQAGRAGPCHDDVEFSRLHDQEMRPNFYRVKFYSRSMVLR